MSNARDTQLNKSEECFEPFRQQDWLQEQDKEGLCFGFTVSMLKHLQANHASLPQDKTAFYKSAQDVTQQATDAYREGNNEYEDQFSKMNLTHQRITQPVTALKDELKSATTAMITFPVKNGKNHTIGFYQSPRGEYFSFDTENGLQKGKFATVFSLLSKSIQRNASTHVTIDRDKEFKRS